MLRAEEQNGRGNGALRRWRRRRLPCTWGPPPAAEGVRPRVEGWCGVQGRGSAPHALLRSTVRVSGWSAPPPPVPLGVMQRAVAAAPLHPHGPAHRPVAAVILPPQDDIVLGKG